MKTLEGHWAELSIAFGDMDEATVVLLRSVFLAGAGAYSAILWATIADNPNQEAALTALEEELFDASRRRL